MQIVLKQKNSYKHMNKKQTSHSTNRHVYTIISTYYVCCICISEVIRAFEPTSIQKEECTRMSGVLGEDH
jgi:hypothetical protein